MAQTLNQRISLITAQMTQMNAIGKSKTGLVEYEKNYTPLVNELKRLKDLRAVFGGNYIEEEDTGEATTTNFLSFA